MQTIPPALPQLVTPQPSVASEFTILTILIQCKENENLNNIDYL